ncbi:MAG: hypothetical protein BLITH_1093 [Brockia lithotrophica]|uniref:Uncharacterized protein n=1 Tax=Brockia lithotrophica TaxID=933949 RepID=A0A2T5G7F9_9BACL|nr:MAG: hypothetical protein BLITH_1093 [Brockia lithotrophica]
MSAEGNRAFFLVFFSRTEVFRLRVVDKAPPRPFLKIYEKISATY